MLYCSSSGPAAPRLDFFCKRPNPRALPPAFLWPSELPSLHERGVRLDFKNLLPFHSWNHLALRKIFTRHGSQSAPATNEAKSALFVDTLALVRKLESQGFTVNQAEAITAAMTDVLNDSLENAAHSFVSKAELQKNEMMQEAALAKVKGEIQHAQEYKVSLLQREVERIRTDVEKMRSDLRYEIDKVTAAQRLDINLERGRTREDLANQSAETSELTNKLDREIHSLKTQVEAAKYEVIKYGIGTIVSITAVGLGLLRILM